MTRKPIFLSYSRKDTRFRDLFVTHLGVIGRQEDYEAWTDQSIRGGDRWRDAIDKGLRDAEIVVLLVSANSLTSSFILDTEVAEVIRAAKRVYPILVRDCAWNRVPWLCETQMRPRPLKALALQSPAARDTAMTGIVNELDDLLGDGSAPS